VNGVQPISTVYLNSQDTTIKPD